MLFVPFVLLISFAVCFMTAYAQESPTSDLTMVVGSSCYIYSTNSAAAKNRVDYLTFGQEVSVSSVSGDWATIQYGGAERYIRSANLDYLTQVVIKNRVMVSPGAYACSETSTLGYVYYGTQVSVLGTSTTKSGVTYVHCLVEQTYQADGVTVRNRNVEGYINAAYLTESATPKVINGGTNLYQSAYGSASSEELKQAVGTITTGEEVQMLMSNATWSKIRYNGEEYYVSTNKLDAKKLQIMVGRAAQTVDAKPGSGWQHYSYWNASITVLNTYESETYGTYYYCELSGDYGFIREYSSSGLQYIGYTEKKTVTGATPMYQIASSSSSKLMTLQAGAEVTVQYSSGNWARVEYNGTVGYVSADKLEYPQYIANGKYYTSGYNLYCGSSAGTLKNETVSLLATYSGRKYACVQTKDGTRAWMKLSSLKAAAGETVMYTSVPSVTLHTAQSSSSVSVSVPYMTELILCETYDNSGSGAWSKVKYNDSFYYLWQDTGVSLLTEQKSSFTYTGSTAYQQDVIDLALEINGWETHYAHGESDGVADSSGSYGFDCSGFAAYVLNNVMQQYVPTYHVSANIVSLYETGGIYNEGYAGSFAAADVIAEGGTLDISKLQPGDLLFFDLTEETDAETTGTGYNHCGIYLGNGEWIHCTHSWGGGVCIMPLSGIYEEGFVAARRYLPAEVTAASAVRYTTSQKTYVYAEADSSTTPVDTLGAEVAVTVLYTDNGNWAYVRYGSSSCGYVLVKYLAASVEEAAVEMYTVKPGQKLYTSYSTGSDYVQVLVGTQVTYLGRYSTSSYYKVLYNAETYYVYAPNGIDGFLLEKDDFEMLLAGGTAYTLDSNSYLRSTPNSSDSSNQILLLKSGTTVYVISMSDTVSGGKAWCYVRTADGLYGYLYMTV